MSVKVKSKTMLKRGLPPAHPGEVLKAMFIDERGLTITIFSLRKRM